MNAPLTADQCPDVVFATPSLMHAVAKRYNRSMLQTSWAIRRHGMTDGYMDRDGDCFVAKARNKLFADFLAEFPTTQNFFFIDDDIGWPAQKVIEFLMRPEDVIAGVYPKKSDDTDFPVSLLIDDNGLVERNGLFLAQLAPTGFMRIKRHVIEKLSVAAPRFRDIEPDGSDVTYPCVFEAGPGPDGRWWGEDYTFCQKWRALGGEIWVDPDIEFEHQGLKTWKNTLVANLDVFRAKAAQQKRAAPVPLREAIERELAAE